MDYRCYHIANMYLPGIHAGIQSAHSQHALAQKYAFPIIDGKTATPQFHQYREWVDNHKVIVCLNGGMSVSLENLSSLLESEKNPFAWVEWRESEEALNGAITNVAVVLPQRVYANNLVVGSAAAPHVFGNDLEKNIKLRTGRGEEFLILVNRGSGYEAILMDREHGNIVDQFTAFETHLMAVLSGMRLMN